MLNNRPDIVVCTPGRIWKCYESSHPYLQNLSSLEILVLDEADRLVTTGDFAELKMLLGRINGEEAKAGAQGNLMIKMMGGNDPKGKKESKKAKFEKKGKKDEKSQKSEKEDEMEDETTESGEKTEKKVKIQRQTMMFSATLGNNGKDKSSKVSDLKKIIQMNSGNTKVINLGKTHEERMPEKLKEFRIDTNDDLKEAISFYLIKKCEKEGEGKRRTIIFANTESGKIEKRKMVQN